MKNKTKTIGLIVLTLCINQAFAAYTMKSYTINNGASKIMKGGSYELQASVGQVDGSHIQAAGNYQLNGGFWHENTDLIFKNNLEN